MLELTPVKNFDNKVEVSGDEFVDLKARIESVDVRSREGILDCHDTTTQIHPSGRPRKPSRGTLTWKR